MQIADLVFLGAGQMAEALVRGILAAGLLPPERIFMSDVRRERLEELAGDLGVQVASGNVDAISRGRTVILSVKPQDIQTVLAEVGEILEPDQLIISIAAGVTLARLEGSLGPRSRVIRVMPNTPALVGQGMAVIARGTHASDTDEETALAIFGAVGKALTLPENLMDAVTALSGSGPAFIGLVADALIDGGVRAGIPRSVATTLALQTIYGSGQMMLEAEIHPARLRDMVTSPGGTAIAGIHALEAGGVRAAMIEAVLAATRRSKELAG